MRFASGDSHPRLIAPAAAALGLLVVLGACGLDKAEKPAVSGPSETAISVQLTALPDTLNADGVSTSTIQLVLRENDGSRSRASRSTSPTTATACCARSPVVHRSFHSYTVAPSVHIIDPAPSKLLSAPVGPSTADGPGGQSCRHAASASAWTFGPRTRVLQWMPMRPAAP